MSLEWEEACRWAADRDAGEGGIGTLRERTLHAVLKQWLDDDPTHQEVTVEGRVADLFDGECVTEIQTRGLYTLKPKLDRLLPRYRVTVVHPLACVKQIIWVDPDSGETTKPRRSPHTGQVWDAFHELYSLRDYLTNDRLTVRLVLADMEEYRLRDGWAREGKRGSHRVERIPGALVGQWTLSSADDYAALIPDAWGERFTTVDVARLLRVRRRLAGEIVAVLYAVGAIVREGKSGRAYCYRRTDGGSAKNDKST